MGFRIPVLRKLFYALPIAFNKALLLRARAPFELLLESYCIVHVVIVGHEHYAYRPPVVSITARISSLIVFRNSSFDIVCDSNIVFAIAAPDHINEIAPHSLLSRRGVSLERSLPPIVGAR